MSKRAVSFETAKTQYLHRYTMEFIPAWARKSCNGKFYAPQFASDLEWYENTVFPGECGKPKKDDHCETHGQTWPLGQWLDNPPPAYPGMWK